MTLPEANAAILKIELCEAIDDIVEKRDETIEEHRGRIAELLGRISKMYSTEILGLINMVDAEKLESNPLRKSFT